MSFTLNQLLIQQELLCYTLSYFVSNATKDNKCTFLWH